MWKIPNGKFEIITGTSIVVLSIQIKPFEVFGATPSADYNGEDIIYLLLRLVQNK